MRFSSDDIRAFATWSRDCNPLHVDAAFARQTFFGQPIAHGMLSVLAALETAGVDAATITGLEIEFRGAVLPGTDYRIDTSGTAGTIVVAPAAGGDPVLAIRTLHAGSVGEAVATIDEQWLSTIRQQPPLASTRELPASRTIDELAQGAEVAGLYTMGAEQLDSPGAQAHPVLAQLLALASYVVGMELPGERSLFTRATLQLAPQENDVTAEILKQGLAYRARVTRFERHFRLLDVQLEVATASGTPIAAGLIRSYVPFSPPQVDVDRLASQLTPEARRLKGRVALVCGGSRGLGADIAAALALAGCHVYATGRESSGLAPALSSGLERRGAQVEFVQGDAGDPAWCRATLEQIQRAHGHLDVLVLNACAPPSALRLDAEHAASQADYITQNLRLVQVPLAASLAAINASHGAVAYVSSSFVQDAPDGFSHYVAVKQAGEALVRAAQQESPATLSCIARPPRLQTSWNDTPAAAASSIAPERAAIHLVNELATRWGSGGTTVLTEFPPLAAAAPASSPGRRDEPAFPVRIAATFTTDPLMPPLAFWLRTLDAGEEIEIAPYGQVLQSLLDPASVLSGRGGLNVVLFRVHDWLHELPEEKSESVDFLKTYLADAAADFERAMQAHRGRAGAPTLFLVCPARSTASREVQALVEETEARLCAALGTLAGLHIAFARDYHERYGVDEAAAADPLREKIAHIPYRDAYYDTLATVIARWVHRQRTPARKVVVVDCDNTLWGGVVGEVGAEGIALEPHHLALHDTLRTLGRSGVLICLCSKNEEADVWSVFDTRADMHLKREDVVAATINWQPKSENLRSLASRLNLGLDSFIFVDDNPVECAEVRAHCPEVLTLEWPQDAARARQLLQHAWEFEPRGATAEDERRTQLYREEFKRQELRTQTLSFADFIGSLDVDIQIEPLSAADLKRASQLTLRTNQFNFTTRRRDEGELQRLVDAGAHDVRTVRVKDRFGDYGLVGLLIAENQPDAVFADTFLLSCRVLGRGVEHRMAAELGRIAVARGVDAVRLRVDPTKRNAPARTFLTSFSGAEPAADGVLESELAAGTLAEFRYIPTEQEAARADEANEAPAATAAALPVDRIRERETLISRIAFELSDPVRLRAAVEGRTTAAATPDEAVSGVDEAIYAAFAATLRVPSDTVRTVDRLEALGCDSLKIVEITVALLERYPSLPTTLLFEHKAVSDIIRHVRTLLSPEASARTAGGPALAEAPRAATGDAAFEVAVVGMDVRCGGANSPAELWALLSEARSAVAPVAPARRHFLHPLNDSRPYWASLLPDPGRFDAEFFGVSPREAEYMDPQLRLFLEVAWGALEDAGCVGVDHEPDTGVFAGVMYGDYAHRANIRGTGDHAYRCWEGFSLANRLSQLLGFRGPSLAVDTACSSSGTAMHLACRALAAGDCRVAVVGGVNLILDPDRFGSLGHLGILSPRGKCEPFGADADGTALGEGAGVVILRPLAEALRRGDRIHGVIKGTGVSTGSGTVGFTAPNPQAQAQAIERSLRTARVDPRTISYVEAHGTGTVLGDPIEVRGLTLAYSKPELHDGASDVITRRRLGSIKPNVGHLEAGAAVVGLIKVLLQLQRGMLLPSITSPAPNPQIPFDGTTLDVQRTLEPWDRPTATANGVVITVPRRAGVSSFGVGGANAHIIVEEPPAVHEQAAAADRSQHLLAISASSDAALEEQLRQLQQHVENDSEIAVADLAFSMNAGRQHFAHRATIRFADRAQLLASLDELSQGATPKRAAKSDVSGRSAPRVSFLFTGQGSQYAGMGRQLYDTQPVFRAALDRCAEIFDRLLGEPLRDLLFANDDGHASRLDQTGFTQPALFAFEYALSELWRSWGIRPDVVMGHSVGEIAAMCVAGGLSLEDGLTLIAARGRLMQALPAGGAMTSVMAPEALVADTIADVRDQVAIAAINGPGQVVISGVGTVVADISARLESAGIKTKALAVSHAFHSPLMTPMLAEYEAVVRSIELRTPAIPFVSCVDGTLVTAEVTRPEYWIRQIMDPVRFAAGMSALERERIDAFIEVGPQPVLLGMGRQCVTETTVADWLPSLRKDVDSWTTLLDSVATLYGRGATIDWKGFDAPYARTRVAAPTYAFTPKQYWLRMPALTPTATPSMHETANAGVHVTEPTAAPAGPALYQVEWQPQPLADVRSPLPRSADHWVIFADRSGVGAELAAELTAAGAQPLVVVPGKRFERTWDGQYQVNPESVEDLQKLWASIKLGGVSSMSIAHLFSLDVPAAAPGVVADVVGIPLVSATNIVRSIAAGTLAVRAAWFVTRGAVVPVAALLTDRVAIEQAPLWGLGRTIALEHPDVWGGLVDVSPGDEARRDVPALARELLSADGEDQVALRGDVRFVARLTASSPPANAITISGDVTYLITGGTGALGLHVAAWFVARGARHVALVARRPNQAAAAAAESWRQQGIDVTILNADISSPVDVERIIKPLANSRAPLRGIVHAAGVDSEAPLSTLDRRELSSAHAAKALGAWMLHERTQQIPLDFFVCFSSIASVIGSQGHAHYGAANAYLDALILERQRSGLTGTGINWGPWAGGGMAAPEQLDRFRRIGNLPLEPDAAVNIFGQLLGAPASGVVVADIDWTRFRDVYEARRRRPLIANLVDGSASLAPAAAESTAAGIVPTARSVTAAAPWMDLLRTLPEAERLERLTVLLRTEVATALGLERPEDVRVDRTLYQMGMDSLMMAGFIGRLREMVGVSCTAIVFDHPQVPALASRLLEQLPLSAAGATVVTELAVATTPAPLAVAQIAAAGASTSPVTAGQPITTAVAASESRTGIEGYSRCSEPEVFEFQKIAFPDRRPDLIPERWRWMFVRSAERLGVDPRVWLYRQDNHLAGQMGAIPVRLKVGGDSLDTAWLVDTMVLQRYRHTAAGARLMVQAHDDLPFALSLGQTSEMREIQFRLGWSEVAPLQVSQLLLRPERVLKGKLAAPAVWPAALGLRAWSSIRERGRGRAHAQAGVHEIASFDSRHDALWNRVARDLTCAVVRDASYLNWKYVDQPGQSFVRLELTERNSLLGSAVLMLREPDAAYAYRRAFLVDLVAPMTQEGVLDALLQGTSEIAARHDADAIVCLHIGEPLTRALKRAGFHNRKPTRFLLVDTGGLSQGQRDLALDAGNWFVTQGDSDIDRPGQ